MSRILSGGVHGGGACVVVGGHASQGVCMVRGHVWQGACMVGGVHGIWSMSGWYASYWNAFLLSFLSHDNDNGMVFRYTWVYSKEDTMAHTRRLVVTS